jgi:hypothetical protein
MAQYIVPPSYRAGQGNRLASNVKDSLALMDFLVRLKQEKMSTKIDDARYYARQAAEEGSQTRRDERLHKYGLEEIEKRETLQIGREDRALVAEKNKEQRIYGKGGFQSDKGKEELYRGLLSEYDTDDIKTDDKGWSSVVSGALTKADKAKASDDVFKLSGFQTKYSKDPKSEFQTLWTVFRQAQSMQHPETDVRIRTEGKKRIPEFFYPNMGGLKAGTTMGYDIDHTPGAFTQGDIAPAIRDLSKLIEGTGLPETAVSNMFHSGLSKNQQFMDSKDYQSYQSINKGIESTTQGIKASTVNVNRTQQLINQSSSTEQNTKNKASLDYVATDVFGTIYSQFFTTEDDVMKTTETMNQKMSDLNEKNPDLAHATRALFFQGSNYLNEGGPNTYEVYDDFFAKFIMHDEPGRGGSPSVAQQSFEAMGLSNEYKKVKDIVDGKDIRAGKKGSIEHIYVMDSAVRMAEGKQEEMPFAKDILDEYFRDASGQSTPILKSLDTAKERGDLSYKYEGNKLIIIFDDEQNVHAFRQAIKGQSPVEMQTFDSLIRNNLIDIQIK